MKSVQWIGASCGSGAQDRRTAAGPAYYFDYASENSPYLFFNNPPYFVQEKSSGHKLEALDGLSQFNVELAELVEPALFPCVIGGDHSCAVGTWSGVSRKLRGSLGLLWIDAHMDAHTFQSTPSGAIHGMPVAALLGEGAPSLTQIAGEHAKVRPENLVLFGVRSYEPEEKALLQKFGVRVYGMEEIRQRGFVTTWREAMSIVTQGTSGFGITLDLDALDPHDVPAVGSPVAGGIHQQEILSALDQLSIFYGASQWSGIEIVEFNPNLDVDDQTCEFIHQCVLTVGAKMGLASPSGDLKSRGQQRQDSGRLATARSF